MAERVFVLPDLGEGLEEAVVTAWLVAEGDEVELNQPIAEIETTKAVVEMPSPFAGRIARLHASGGSTVAVGAPLVTFEIDVGAEPVRLGEAATLPAPPPAAAAPPALRQGPGGSPVPRPPPSADSRGSSAWTWPACPGADPAAG